MTRLFYAVCVVAAFIFSAEPVMAQAKPKGKPVKEEEVIPPPPPRGNPPGVSLKRAELPGIPISFDTTALPGDELTAAISELLETTNSFDLGTQFGKALLDQKNSPNNRLPAEFYDRIFKELETGESNKWYKNNVIRVYRNYYTLEETRQILAFYKTPAGKKMISVLPQLLQESMQVGGKLGEYVGMKVFLQMKEEGKIPNQ